MGDDFLLCHNGLRIVVGYVDPRPEVSADGSSVRIPRSTERFATPTGPMPEAYETREASHEAVRELLQHDDRQVRVDAMRMVAYLAQRASEDGGAVPNGGGA